MNRVLLDQGLAPNAALLLRADGWDALHVSEAGLSTAEDSEILDFARQEGRICITLDHDFHRHLALAGSGQPSVVFVRIEGLNARAQADLLKAVWGTCGNVLLRGAAVSVDAGSIRIRELPVK